MELSRSPRKLVDFRTYLTEERGLKLKSARTKERSDCTGTCDVLGAAKPFHIGVDEHVFKYQDGQLLNFHTWSAKERVS